MSDEDEIIKLDACPFCGGLAEFCSLDEPEDSPNWNGEVVGCLDCGASTAVVFPAMDSGAEHLQMLWNRRR